MENNFTKNLTNNKTKPKWRRQNRHGKRGEMTTKEKISKLVEKCNENLASDKCCEGCFGTVLQGDCLFSNLGKPTIDALYESALKGAEDERKTERTAY